MTDEQPPAQFDWATELLDAEGHVTLSAKEAKEIGARLRSMGEKLKAYEDLDEAASDVQLLRMGYAAARLEIESLRAARAPADSVLEDAARYRWLRQEHERVDPVCHLTWKRNLQRDSSEWVNTAVLDTAIDNARKQGGA